MTVLSPGGAQAERPSAHHGCQQHQHGGGGAGGTWGGGFCDGKLL